MSDLHIITRELEEARNDRDLFNRLSASTGRVEELTARYERAKAVHDRAVAAAEAAAKAARFAGLSDIQVTRTGPTDENLVRAGFKISWTFTGDDGRGETLSKRASVQGFRALGPVQFAFLIENHPERIPAEISALAPGDPEAAFDAYFTALRRGYHSAPKAAAV